jgi:hypothetical protein
MKVVMNVYEFKRLIFNAAKPFVQDAEHDESQQIAMAVKLTDNIVNSFDYCQYSDGSVIIAKDKKLPLYNISVLGDEENQFNLSVMNSLIENFLTKEVVTKMATSINSVNEAVAKVRTYTLVNKEYKYKVEAVKWNGENFDEIKKFDPAIEQVKESLVLKTLKGVEVVNKGDWVIKNKSGRFYSCRDIAFGTKYSPV